MADELSKQEQEYFESGGETDLKPAGEDTAGADTISGEDTAPGEDTAQAAGADSAEAGESSEAAKPGEGKAKATGAVAELIEERHGRKAAERERDALKTMLDKFEQLIPRPKAEAEPEPELPKKDDDPVAYFDALIARFGSRLEKLEGQGKQLSETQQEAENRNRFYAAYTGFADEIAGEAPDFRQAREFLHNDRNEELKELGYADPAIRARIIQREEEGIVGNLMQQGMNPAKSIYALAKRRGYKPAAAGTAKGNGAGQPEKPKAPGSLANLRGTAPAGNLTIESALKMSDKEFAALSDEDLRSIAGG